MTKKSEKVENEKHKLIKSIKDLIRKKSTKI